MPRPTDHRVVAGGLRLHYLDWGRRGGRPLLLVHGAAQTAHSFDEVAPDLARDHHVVAMDQRGHGESDWAPAGRYRRTDYTADLAAMLDGLGWRTAALIAMSLGGLNAIAFAAAHPERVRGLVLVDVVPTVAAPGREAIAAQLAVRDFASFDEAVERAHAFNPRRTLENIRERLRHALREQSDGRWSYRFDPAMGEGAAANLDWLWVQVRRLRCPTLLIRGAESPVLSLEGATRFLSEARGSRMAEVAGAGHSVMGDNPAGFVAAVRPFLARHAI